MADNFKYAQLQPFALAGSGISIGATTITLQSFLSIDGVPLTMLAFGTIGYGTLEPNSFQREEQISFTGITQNLNGTATLTGVKTVDFLYPYTEVVGVSKSHPGGATFVITNTSGFYDKFTSKNNDETIANVWTFTTPNYPIVDNSAVFPTLQAQLASKAYVDSVVVAGAPDATTAVKGVVELATPAEFAAGTSIGGTGAFLVPANSSFREIPIAGSAPVGTANAIINPSWTDLIFVAGENIDTTGGPLAVYLEYSTGSVKKTAGGSFSESVFGFVGFAPAGQNIAIGNNIKVRTQGIVGGFAGLTPGEYYYISNVSGAITLTPSAPNYQVARARTAAEILIVYGKITSKTNFTFNASATTTINVGFKATSVVIYAWGAPNEFSTGSWDSNGSNSCMTNGTVFGVELSFAWEVLDGAGNVMKGIVNNVTNNSFDLVNTQIGVYPFVALYIQAFGN